MMDKQDVKQYNHVEISTGDVDMADWDLGIEKKEFLILSGYYNTQKWLVKKGILKKNSRQSF